MSSLHFLGLNLSWYSLCNVNINSLGELFSLPLWFLFAIEMVGVCFGQSLFFIFISTSFAMENCLKHYKTLQIDCLCKSLPLKALWQFVHLIYSLDMILYYGIIVYRVSFVWEALLKKKRSKYGHCPNWLNPSPSILGGRGALSVCKSRHFEKCNKTAKNFILLAYENVLCFCTLFFLPALSKSLKW